MLHWHSPREDLIGVIALIVYVITCGSLNGGRNGSILDSHTIYFLSFGAFNLQESPLRIRGKSQRHLQLRNGRRITPAHAGKRAPGRKPKTPWRDHPRACGEKSFQLQCHVREEGSPPRMRGEGLNIIRILVCRRITPAHAGRRQYAELANNKGEDHPRACGEKLSTALKRRQRTGSPPRMRGEENPVTAGLLALRITPAHAGRSPSRSRHR